MKPRAATPLVQILIIAFASTFAHAQSVADVARAEREKNATQQAKPAKVLSNEDLSGRNRASQGEPSAGPSSPECNEISAANDLEVLSYAEGKFSFLYGSGFTEGLNRLGPPEGGTTNMTRAGLLDAVMSGLSQGGSNTEFVKSGYRFVYTPGPPVPSGHIEKFAIISRPLQYNVTGKRSFFVSMFGGTFVTDEDRGASEKDIMREVTSYPRDKLQACLPNTFGPTSQPMPSELKFELGVSDYSKWPVRERQKQIASLELALAEGAEDYKAAGIEDPGEGARADERAWRAEIERIRNANPPLPPEKETGGSLEAKKRQYYSFLSENERRYQIAKGEKDVADLEKSQIQNCGPGKTQTETEKFNCDLMQKGLKDGRRELQLLQSTPPAP